MTTQVDTHTQSFLTDFFAAWPFNHLPANLQASIAPELQLCSFQPGELIYPSRELPSAIHCIVQERVRILGPTSYQSPTLEVVGDGTIIGWDSLLRRVSVGSVRAAMTSPDSDREVLTLALSADTFEMLALKHLLPVLMRRVSLMELFDTLSRALAKMPDRTAGINLTEVVHYIDREKLAVAQHWHPETETVEALSLKLTPDRVWLISGGASLNLPIGSPVRDLEQLQQVHPSPFPVRLLGIDRTCLASAVLNRSHLSLPAATEPAFDQSVSPPMDALAALSDVDALTTESIGFDVTAAKTYPVWRATAPDLIEDIVACFGMVCERLQIPFRPDSLRRSLKQQAIEKFEPFDLYVRIAQAIGLNAHIVSFTPTPGGINRLTTPALIECSNILAVAA